MNFSCLDLVFLEFFIELEVPEGFTFVGDREDMLELFGNLLDNACKWAHTCVYLVIQGPGLYFTLEDDGPGVPEAEMALLAERGHRLDEATPGHELGLAIAQEIVGHYGGDLGFSRSELGGLRVEVTLPAN